MLTKDSIILGQMIASGLGEEHVINPSGIMSGLNEVSHGAFPFSSTDYVNQLVELTTQVTPHTDVMDMATTEMAKIIRGAFDMIKTYGVPLASKIADGVGLLYSNNSIMRIIRDNIEIDYLSVDHPFFNLSIYPTEAKNQTLSYTAVGLDSLKRLEFDWMGEDKLIEWMGTNHPEVAAVMNDKVSSNSSAFYTLTNFNELGSIFKQVGENTFDFTAVKDVDVVTIMKMYLIVSKMFTSSEPVECLVKGSSEDYRAYVNLMWNCLATYLGKLAHFAGVFRARQVAIVNKTPLAFKEITPSETLGVKVDVVSGSFTVYYTDEIMRQLTANTLAISDVVLANLYGRASGNDIALLDLAKSPSAVKGLLDRYRDSVGLRITQRANEYFAESTIKAIAEFIDERPAVREAAYKTAGDTGKMVPSLVREKLMSEVNKLYIHYSRNLAESEDLISSDSVIIDERKKHCIDIILSTDLVPSFLKFLGCDLAAEIIRATYTTQAQAFTAVGEREKLHEALIQVMAGTLVG